MMETIKEGNVLGSGPSRVSYTPNGLPSIGCNFPWTKVDYTLIFDVQVIIKYMQVPETIPSPTKFILGHHVYAYIKKMKWLDHFDNRIYSTFKHIHPDSVKFRRSSGHLATEWMISQGFNKLNLYGMDNYFGDLACLDNFTHKEGTLHYLDNVNLTYYTEAGLIERGKDWQKAWTRLINENPSIEFNFIK